MLLIEAFRNYVHYNSYIISGFIIVYHAILISKGFSGKSLEDLEVTKMLSDLGSPSSCVQDELIRNLLSFAVRFQSRSRVFRILLMRFLHRR